MVHMKLVSAMSAIDAIAYAVGETTAYVAGRIVGRTFAVERKRAQRVGEYVMIGALIIVLVTITLIYS